MDKIIEYSGDSPNKAIICILLSAVVGLCGVIVVLWEEQRQEEVKNFNMILKSIESFRQNGVALDSVKTSAIVEFNNIKNKMDQLLEKINRK